MTRHAKIHAALLTARAASVRELMLATKLPTQTVERCLSDLEDLRLARFNGQKWVSA